MKRKKKILMAKRFDPDTIAQMKHIAEDLGITLTALMENCFRMLMREVASKTVEEKKAKLKQLETRLKELPFNDSQDLALGLAA